MDELVQAREQWHDVYEDSGLKLSILTYEYVKLWYECFSSPKDIRVFKVMDGGKTIGFLPMVLRSGDGVRVLMNQTNDHCLYGEALIRRGCEEVFSKKLLDEILDESGWDVLHHIFGYSFSAVYPLFSESLLDHGKHRWKMNVQPTYTVLLDKTCYEYFQKDLSMNMRKSLKRFKNRLNKTGQYKFLHFEEDATAQKWQEFLRIEDSGWKGRNGTSILRTTPEYRRYYDGLIRILSMSRDLHLYFLELDQKYIAAVVGFTAGDVFQYLKIGYDEEYHALSPSNMLFMHLVKDIQENLKQIKRIHLFPYDDTGYKKRYANEEQQFAEIIIYNNTLRGQALWMADKLKERIRRHPRLAVILKKVLRV